MDSTTRNRLGILIAVVLLAIGTLFPTFFKDKTPAWWPTAPIRLGLDLRGGSYLILSVQTPEAVKSYLSSLGSAVRAEARTEKLSVLRSRQYEERKIEFTLLQEASVEPFTDFMRREHSELQKIESTASPLKVSYELTPRRSREIEAQSVDQAIETLRNRVDQFGVSEPLIQRSGENRILVQLPDQTDLTDVKKSIGTIAKLEFRLVGDPAKASTPTVTRKSRAGETLQIEEDVLMTGDAIESARVEIDPQDGTIGVSLKFKSFGAKTFEQITGENVGRRLAIVLDNVVQSAPNIRDRIAGGSASISGGFSKEEARQLAVVLRSGALPAPLKFEEQRTIGASLGEDSIHKGIVAALVGSALVILFMIFYYQKAGVHAVIATVINMLLLLAILALLGATLTLPGIAGLALTIGMAVDENVIIYERIREEIRRGISNVDAIYAGFERAHWTILDANLCSLLTGMVLYTFGTGPIKGFAVTLCIGILTTLFAALFITRLTLHLYEPKRSDGKLSI
jgi:preprotein translocase subunit SecD